MTEPRALLACREDEEPQELLGRTETRGLPGGMGRTACPGPGGCRARTDWMASRDRQGLRDCPDLRALLELPDPGAGSETRERPDLRDLSGHRDLPGKTAATARPDLQDLPG